MVEQMANRLVRAIRIVEQRIKDRFAPVAHCNCCALHSTVYTTRIKSLENSVAKVNMGNSTPTQFCYLSSFSSTLSLTRNGIRNVSRSKSILIKLPPRSVSPHRWQWNVVAPINQRNTLFVAFPWTKCWLRNTASAYCIHGSDPKLMFRSNIENFMFEAIGATSTEICLPPKWFQVSQNAWRVVVSTAARSSS